MQKKVFGLLLILCTLVCMLAFAFSVDAVSLLSTDANGVYQITSANDLAFLSQTPDLWGEDFKLTANITIAMGTPYDGNVMKVIGNTSTYFTGTFDGGSKKITVTGTNYRGLFYVVGKGATIENLNVAINVSGNTYAAEDAGGIVGVGVAQFTMENCHVSGTGTITGTNNVGGIIGRWRAASTTAENTNGSTLTVSNCTSAVTVSATGKYVGGIVGFANIAPATGIATGLSIDADNSGAVSTAFTDSGSGRGSVGGLVGRVYATSAVAGLTVGINGTNSGDIEGSDRCVGGIVGEFDFRANTADAKTINIGGTNTGNVTAGDMYAAGSVGLIHVTEAVKTAADITFNISTTTSTGTVSGTTHVGGLVGYATFQHYAATVTLNVSGSNGMTVTGSGGYVGGAVGYLQRSTGRNGSLTSTVSATNTGNVSGKESIGGLVGFFQTQSVAVSSAFSGSNSGNVTATGTKAGGIIGYAALNVEATLDFNSVCYNEGTIQATDYAGGVVGQLLAQASGNSDIDVTAYNTGNVTATGTMAGGVVGYAALNVEATLDFNSGCYNRGTISANGTTYGYAGGIVGKLLLGASVNGATVNFTGTASAYIYNEGDISATEGHAGGIVGELSFCGEAVSGDTVAFSYCKNNSGATLSGSADNLGGIIGNIYFGTTTGTVTDNVVTINNCTNACALDSDDKAVAGIIGCANFDTYASDNTLSLTNCTNSATVTAGGRMAGILGYTKFTNGSSNSLSVNNCENSGALTGKSDAAGIGGVLGYVLHQNDATGSVSLEDCSNTATVTGYNDGIGGVVGYYRHEGNGTGSTFALDGCSNSGDVTGANHAAGVLGYVYLYGTEKLATAKINLLNCSNAAEVSGTGNKIGGILGHAAFLNKGSGSELNLSECTSSGSVSAGAAKGYVGGIAGSIDVSTSSNVKVDISECRNKATVTSAAEYAGGIVGYYNQSSSTANCTISVCQNDGTVNNTGSYTGGIAGRFSTNTADKITFENCLNTGSVNGADYTGGIIGTNSTGKYTVKNVYNNGTVTVADGASNLGQIAGSLVSGTTVTNAHFDGKLVSSSSANNHGSFMRALAFVTIDDSVKANWVYTESADVIELKYFHLKDGTYHNKNASAYRVETSDGSCLLCPCESINCTEGATTVNSADNTTTVYVNAASGTALTAANFASLGSQGTPCNSLDAANLCVERNIALGGTAQTIVIMDSVSVPKCYHMPAVADGLTVEGDGDDSALVFDKGSLYSGAKHLHLNGNTTIQNITIEAKDKNGINIYAENHDLVMGNGITMKGIVDYLLEDKYGEEFAEGESQYDYAGARVYVHGGYDINEWLHETLTNAQLETFEHYEKLYNEIITEPSTVIELTEEQINTIKGYVEAVAACGADIISPDSNITVRSGDYRSVDGWNNEFYFKSKGNGEALVYSVPIVGTANVTVGAGEGQTLNITHLSPFGSEYESFGEGCVANVTVDGDVNVWQFHTSAQVARMNVRPSNYTTAPIGENRYPLTVNLTLDGNLITPINTVTNYWGFQAAGNNQFAVILNLDIGDGEEAIKDAHAYLGHGDYCSASDCTVVATNFVATYVHRKVNIGLGCTCNAGTRTELAIPANCMTYGATQTVCASCGAFKSLDVDDSDINPNFHVYKMQIDRMQFNADRKLLLPVDNGVMIEMADTCACPNPRHSLISGDGTFYVSEKEFTGEADYFAEGIGTEAVPFNDFRTAYRVAVAYASGGNAGRTAKIVILDNASLNIDSEGNLYTDRQQAPYYGTFAPDNIQSGNIIVTGIENANDTTKGTLTFRNSATDQNSILYFTTDMKFENLKLVPEHLATESGSTSRIRIFARNYTLEMGEGLEMPGQEEITPINRAFMIYGGFYSDPEYTMDTEVIIRSGTYYYIGAWNHYATKDEDSGKDGIVDGKGSLTIGGSERISTHFLCAYGVGAEETQDTTVNIYINGLLDVVTFEPAAQNGVTDSSPGSLSTGIRTTNVYIDEAADLNVETVHENGTQLRGKYTVNVFVDNPSANQSLDAVHKLCGHDKGLTNGRGVTNYRHINTFHRICTDENCTLQSVNSSYLHEKPTVGGISSDIDVNVYDMALFEAQGAPQITFDFEGDSDSGCYYVDKDGNPLTIDHRGTRLGVVRFLFDVGMSCENVPTLDPEFRNEFIEESCIRFVFGGTASDEYGAGETIDGIVEAGRAPTFRADIHSIADGNTKTFYAAGYAKFYTDTIETTTYGTDGEYNGMIFRAVSQASARYDRPVLYQY